MIRPGYGIDGGNGFIAKLDVLCDCEKCQDRMREKLAEIKDGYVVIKARRHGQDHITRIPIDEITRLTVK